MNVFLIGVHYKIILRLVLDLTYDPTSLKHQNKYSTPTSQTTSFNSKDSFLRLKLLKFKCKKNGVQSKEFV